MYRLVSSKPAHIIFQNLDYDDFTNNQDLLEIYQWKPSGAGKSTRSTITKQGSISIGRKTKYKQPNETERRGLVTSRVGQEYYRQQLIEKWDGKCAVSKTDIQAYWLLVSLGLISFVDNLRG